MNDALLQDIFIDADIACDRLQASFGVPFSVWEDDAGTWVATKGAESPHQDHELSAWLDSQRSNLEQGQPVSLPDCSGQLLLAVPVNSVDDPLAVAVGRLSSDPESLAVCAGTLSRAALFGTAAVDDLTSVVNEYRVQVTADFEERTFLRHIARNVEHCSAAKDIASVASEILPRLRSLARIESIHLVIPKFAAEVSCSRSNPLVVSHALEPVARADLFAVIDRFGRNTSTVPVVCSIDRCPELADVCPQAESVAITALVRDDEHFGWLVAVNRERTDGSDGGSLIGLSENEIGSGEASLLEATGILLATHVHNQRLFAEKEQVVVELVRSLVGVLDARDRYTCGHSDRVATMARMLARSVGLSPAECETIYLSGLLHDLGKISIADDVLLKPGKLTEEEFAQIKEHPQRGYDILKRLEPLRDMLPGVLHHHEAWDGSGYPHGLAGEDIPLIARILAIADTFDALTSSRPYREGMPLGKAIDILKDGAGQQWDAELVGLFLKQIHQMIEVCQSSRDRMETLLHRNEADASDDFLAGSDEIENAIAVRNIPTRYRPL